MTDNKENVPSQEELNSLIWTTVIKSVEAGNCRPRETAQELKQLWREFFDEDYINQQKESLRRIRQVRLERRAALEAELRKDR